MLYCYIYFFFVGFWPFGVSGVWCCGGPRPLRPSAPMRNFAYNFRATFWVFVCKFPFLALCFCAGKFCAVADVYSWLELTWLGLGLQLSVKKNIKKNKKKTSRRRTKNGEQSKTIEVEAEIFLPYRNVCIKVAKRYVLAISPPHSIPIIRRPFFEVQVFALFLYPGSGIVELPIMTVTLVPNWWTTSCEWEFHDH